jgi:hypothetical protein
MQDINSCEATRSKVWADTEATLKVTNDLVNHKKISSRIKKVVSDL